MPGNQYPEQANPLMLEHLFEREHIKCVPIATDLGGGLRDIGPPQKTRNPAHLCGNCVRLYRSTLVFDLRFYVLTPDTIRGGVYSDVILRWELFVGQSENCWEISASPATHSIANTHIQGNLRLGTWPSALRDLSEGLALAANSLRRGWEEPTMQKP
jgi:hypothetical protein